MIKKYIDLVLLKYLMAFYTIAVLINLAKKVYWKLNGRLQTLDWFELVVYNVFIDWVVVILYMIFISHISKIMFEKWKNYKKIILVHLFFSLIMGYFIFTSSSFIIFLFGGMDLTEALSNISLNHFFSVIELNFLIYFAMVGIINAYYYIKKVNQVEHQKTQLQSLLATTQLNTLKAQLHPHFIFNTLNSISSLIETDPEKSQNLIADFGDLLRALLESKDKNLIPLNEELQFLQKFIEIITIRFSDHLTIQQNIAPGLEQVLVPNMLLQPLIENSVKHGYSYDRTDLLIQLNIYKEDHFLLIEILNDGTPLDQESELLFQKGTGLRNTKARLEAIYGNPAKLSLTNNEKEKLVTVRIKIPL